jgi:hypothetical protein
MKKVFWIAMLMTGMAWPASANVSQCGPKQTVAEQLAGRFGELPIVSGISMNNSMKFFGNPKTGSWSMVFIRPDGMACVLAIGEALEVSSLAFSQQTATPAHASDQFGPVK